MIEHIFDKQKWQKQDIFYQMGNIGSEVGRAFNAKRRGDNQSMQAAFYRGLDLIDATVEGLVKQKSPRAKEVLRLRELFAESIVTDKIDDSLEQYLMQFAIASRLISAQ